jgi:hypothetical protein
MVVVGADVVHKRTHTFAAVDEVGYKLAEKVVSATTARHAEAVMWSRERFGSEVVRTRTGLLSQTPSRWRLPHRGSSMPQTTPLPSRLPTPPHRPPKPSNRLPNSSGLT